MRVGDSMVHESIIGSRFTGRIVGTTTVVGRPAILPTIEGRAWITGLTSEMLDPTNPYPTGYVLPETWGVSGTTSQQRTLRRCVLRSKCASDFDPNPQPLPPAFRHIHLARTNGVGRQLVRGAASGNVRDGTTERLHVAVCLMI